MRPVAQLLVHACGERIRDRRMRENRTSGGTRAEAAGFTCPSATLLFHLFAEEAVTPIAAPLSSASPRLRVTRFLHLSGDQ